MHRGYEHSDQYWKNGKEIISYGTINNDPHVEAFMERVREMAVVRVEDYKITYVGEASD